MFKLPKRWLKTIQYSGEKKSYILKKISDLPYRGYNGFV